MRRVIEPRVDDTLAAPFTPLGRRAPRAPSRRERYGLDVDRGSPVRHRARRHVPPSPPSSGALRAQGREPRRRPRRSSTMQCAALAHVAARRPDACPVPRVVPDVDGARARRWCAGADGRAAARTSAHVPARAARSTTPHHGRRSARRSGAAIGRLSLALDGFEHPGADRVLAWDLQRLGGAAPAPRARRRPARPRRRARPSSTASTRSPAPVSRRVRHQVVHNDVNVDNVVVDDAGEVSGILDFGDMVRTAVVADLAVAMSYAVRRRRQPRRRRPRPVAGAVRPRRAATSPRGRSTDDELALLPHLVRAPARAAPARQLLARGEQPGQRPLHRARGRDTPSRALRRLRRRRAADHREGG